MNKQTYIIELYDAFTEQWVPHSGETYSSNKEAELEIIYLSTINNNAISYRVTLVADRGNG